MKELKCESHVKQKIQEKFWAVTIISAHSVLDLPGQVLYLLPESHCSSLGGGEGVSFPHFKAEQKGSLCFSKPEMGSLQPRIPCLTFQSQDPGLPSSQAHARLTTQLLVCRMEE